MVLSLSGVFDSYTSSQKNSAYEAYEILGFAAKVVSSLNL